MINYHKAKSVTDGEDIRDTRSGTSLLLASRTQVIRRRVRTILGYCVVWLTTAGTRCSHSALYSTDPIWVLASRASFSQCTPATSRLCHWGGDGRRILVLDQGPELAKVRPHLFSADSQCSIPVPQNTKATAFRHALGHAWCMARSD
jgi:hypothetical protein